ncbi:hypothetical protein N7486_007955 [Penicillium sp. IBT 16267x]|nr:hypothetical protein N7486_007955 [Penicillium sp. IBT 16267x]
MVGVKVDKPLKGNRDYLFTPEYTSTTNSIEKAGGFYNAITDTDFDRIQVRNDLNEDLVIPRHAFIGHLESFGGEAYMVRLDDSAAHLAAQSIADTDPAEAVRTPDTVFNELEHVTKSGCVVYSRRPEEILRESIHLPCIRAPRVFCEYICAKD